MLFFAMLILCAIGSYNFLYVKGAVLFDALSRTANAYFALYLKPSKLASIGFIWNPLPSMLQIPILVFKDLWPPLATHGISGGIVTAVCAALNTAYLFYHFKKYGQSTALALLFIALYSFNPFIFYYACNGLSEMPFFTSIIIGVTHFARWMDRRSSWDLVVIALSLAFGFLCRYEAMAIALGFAIGFIIVAFFMKDGQSSLTEKSFGFKVNYTTGTWVVAFLPLIYSILIWIAFNWMIMGDPFYFLTSDYSNSASADATSLMEYVGKHKNSLFAPVQYIGIRLWPFIPLFLAITVERILTGRIAKADYWILVAMIGTITLFHGAMLFVGKSFGWIRFFSFAMPICIAWLPYELSTLKGMMKKVSTILFCVALIISSFVTLSYFERSDLAPEEHEALNRASHSTAIPQFEMAYRINESYYDGIILLDTTYTFSVIVNLDHPENLLTHASPNFKDAIENPRRYGVRYILVPNPDMANDQILNAHPNLYEGEADWCVERAEVGDFKLFEVF